MQWLQGKKAHKADNCKMLLEKSPPNENAPEIKQRFHIIVVESALRREHQQLKFIFLGSIFSLQ